MARRSWHDRLFRALLRVFPAEFRERFGREMTDDFHDQVDDARGRGIRWLARVWFRTSRDLLGRAPLEHLDILRRDLVFTARSCRRHPALAFTIVATLAAAIGLNTAVFSVADGVLLRSLPYDDHGRLVRLYQLYQLSPEPDRQRGQVAPANFIDWASATSTLDAMALIGGFEVTVGDRDPESVPVMAVSEGFFRMFPAQPILGRLLAPADYETGPPGRGTGRFALILSHELWQRQFDGRDDAVGRTIHMNFGMTAEVVGVLPPDFAFRDVPGQGRVEGWISEVPDPRQRRVGYRTAIGRVASGSSIEAAQAEMNVIAANLAAAYPDANAGRGIEVAPLHESIVEGVQAQMWFLFGAAFCVLLVACANIAGLLLAFQAGRRQDLATRAALGATRARLIRQFVTHSLALSLVGGAAGVLLAFWLVPSLVAIAPAGIPRLDETALDGRVLLFSVVMTTLIGVVCGLIPCIMMGRRTTTNVLRLTGADARGRGRRVRYGLAVSEVALALMLVVAAGLMVRTVRAVGALDLGFDPDRVISIGLTPSEDWSARGGKNAFESALLERVRVLPHVVAAGIGSKPLGGAGLGMGVSLPASAGDVRCCDADAVSPGFLEALGADLLEGRFFTDRDHHNSPPVVIINQAAARLGWPDGHALGQHLTISGRSTEIVGILGDVRRRGLEESPLPTLYLVSSQASSLWMNNILIRTSGDPAEILPAVRAIMRDVDPTQALTRIQTLDDALATAQAPRRFTLQLIGLFSAVALGLAALGVYGLVSEAVSQRVPEFGIRMALGATPGRILRSVVLYGAGIVVIGATVGLLGAMALNRTMESLVFGVETTDVVAYGTASAVLILATLAACLIPAQRAASVDPVRALRQE